MRHLLNWFWHKKLFQCPAVEISLGGSTTNCHAYDVWVHGCALMIASNKWDEQVAQLPVEKDEELLRDNAIVLRVPSGHRLYED